MLGVEKQVRQKLGADVIRAHPFPREKSFRGTFPETRAKKSVGENADAAERRRASSDGTGAPACGA